MVTANCCAVRCVCVWGKSAAVGRPIILPNFFLSFSLTTPEECTEKKIKDFIILSIRSLQKCKKMQNISEILFLPLSLSLTAIYIWQTGDRSIFRNRPSHQHLSYNIYNNIACKSNPHRKYLRGRWSEPIVLSHSIVCVAQAEETRCKKKQRKK